MMRRARHLLATAPQYCCNNGHTTCTLLVAHCDCWLNTHVRVLYRPVPQCYPHSATEFVVFFVEDGEYWLLDAIKHARRYRKATQADAKRFKRLAKERKAAGAAATAVTQPVRPCPRTRVLSRRA
jgi:hypothetical protein